MAQRKKILLRSEDLFGLENQDMFINIQVENFSKDIKPSSYENVFDLQAQFDNERNNSREFFIYGDVKSVFRNSAGVQLKLFAETRRPTDLSLTSDITVTDFGSSQNIGVDRLTFLNGSEATLIDLVTTQRLFESNNIFGYNQGVYKFQLANNIYQGNEFDVIYILYGNASDLQKNLVKQTLIFRDPDGEVIDFGTDTEEIRDDGTTFTVFNDFPFFYNIHWIKTPFQLNR
jgi:hypothetical protein